MNKREGEKPEKLQKIYFLQKDREAGHMCKAFVSPHPLSDKSTNDQIQKHTKNMEKTSYD